MEIVNTKDSSSHNPRYKETFMQGIIGGIGWAFGITFGFLLITILLGYLLKGLGGLPLVGNWLASIVETTLDQLAARAPATLQQ